MKHTIIRSDLAINGAPPAYPEPLHVGRPNIRDRETFLNLVGEIFDSGWLASIGPLVQALQQRLESQLCVTYCVAACNGSLRNRHFYAGSQTTVRSESFLRTPTA